MRMWWPLNSISDVQIFKIPTDQYFMDTGWAPSRMDGVYDVRDSKRPYNVQWIVIDPPIRANAQHWPGACVLRKYHNNVYDLVTMATHISSTHTDLAGGLLVRLRYHDLRPMYLLVPRGCIPLFPWLHIDRLEDILTSFCRLPKSHVSDDA